MTHLVTCEAAYCATAEGAHETTVLRVVGIHRVLLVGGWTSGTGGVVRVFTIVVVVAAAVLVVVLRHLLVRGRLLLVGGVWRWLLVELVVLTLALVGLLTVALVCLLLVVVLPLSLVWLLAVALITLAVVWSLTLTFWIAVLVTSTLAAAVLV